MEEKFEYIKKVIRISKSTTQWLIEKGQSEKNNDLQNITKKTRAQATGTTLKSGVELRCAEV